MPHRGWDDPQHSTHYGPPPWVSRWGNRSRFFFGRFLFVFGFFSLVFLLAIGVVLALTLGPLRAAGISPDVVFLAVCGIPIAVLLIVSIIGGWLFRRFGSPMAEVMAAADCCGGR